MKAVVIHSFGGPEKMVLEDVPTPRPKGGEVQVEIDYTSVNPVDWKIREGYLAGHLPHELPIILGWDAAGTVSELGEGVTQFKKGDRVFAYCRKPVVKDGTYAEVICLDVASVALSPKNISMGEAAAIPLVALTAWQALYEDVRLQKGETALIHAGAGGVGGFAIQFAKETGARVMTTANSRNHGYVKELGADHAFDYTTRPFAESVKEVAPEGVDVIFDCVGGETLKQSYSLLKKGGRLVSIVDTPDAELAKKLGIEAQYHFVTPNGVQLTQIASLIEAGRVRALPIEEMPLSAVAQAHEKNQTRHVRGKIVLKVK